MRFYSFVHSFLGSIHKGIQTAHLVGEMASEYKERDLVFGVFSEWAHLHKTIIILEGGNSENMPPLLRLVTECSEVLGLPRARFREDDETMEGLLTAVGVIVPEEIYSGKFCETPLLDGSEPAQFGNTEWTKRVLYTLIKLGRLAI